MLCSAHNTIPLPPPSGLQCASTPRSPTSLPPPAATAASPCTTCAPPRPSASWSCRPAPTPLPGTPWSHSTSRVGGWLLVGAGGCCWVLLGAGGLRVLVCWFVSWRGWDTGSDKPLGGLQAGVVVITSMGGASTRPNNRLNNLRPSACLPGRPFPSLRSSQPTFCFYNNFLLLPAPLPPAPVQPPTRTATCTPTTCAAWPPPPACTRTL